MEPSKRGLWTSAAVAGVVVVAVTAGVLLDLGGGDRGTAVAQGVPPRTKGPLPKGTPVRGPEGLPPDKGGIAPKARPSGTPPLAQVKEALGRPGVAASPSVRLQADGAGRTILRSGETAEKAGEYRLGSADGLIVSVPSGLQLTVGGLAATESGPRILLIDTASGSTVFIDTINATVAGYEIAGAPETRGIAERGIRSITVRRGVGQ